MLWLFPIAIGFLFAFNYFTNIDLGYSILIAILLIGLTASFFHTFISLKWELIQTRFGTYYKSDNPSKFHFMVSLNIVAFILLASVLSILVMFV